jgi:hypothetical protein
LKRERWRSQLVEEVKYQREKDCDKRHNDNDDDNNNNNAVVVAVVVVIVEAVI